MKFEELFAPHIDQLYRIAFRWTQDQSEAEDLVQDVAIKLMDQVDTLQALDKPLPWISKVMYRMFVDNYRRKQIMPISDSEATEEAESDESPIEETLRGQLGQKLLLALEELDGPQRTAFTLFELEGYKLQEIAEIQEVSIGTVKSRVHRAKESLKKSLSLQPFREVNRVLGRG